MRTKSQSEDLTENIDNFSLYIAIIRPYWKLVTPMVQIHK